MEVLIASAAVIGLTAAVGGWAYLRSRPRRARLGPDGMQDASIVIRERYQPSVIVARCGVPVRLKFIRDETTRAPRGHFPRLRHLQVFAGPQDDDHRAHTQARRRVPLYVRDGHVPGHYRGDRSVWERLA